MSMAGYSGDSEQPVDAEDGIIHLSTGKQAKGNTKHIYFEMK